MLELAQDASKLWLSRRALVAFHSDRSSGREPRQVPDLRPLVTEPPTTGCEHRKPTESPLRKREARLILPPALFRKSLETMPGHRSPRGRPQGSYMR